MINIGNVFMKIAGRDAGEVAVIVEVLDRNFVIVDGGVRRRKVNIKHLEPLDKKVDIKKGASTEEVLKALDKIGLKVTKVISVKNKETKARPKKEKKVKAKKEEKPKAEKKSPKKKEAKKKEKKEAPKTEEKKE